MSSETLPVYRQPGKTYDALGRAVPRNPFAGTPGLVLALRMGLASQFETRVPEPEYRLGPWVLCTCGELQALEYAQLVKCAGHCGRWFLRLESSVRVARWAPESEAA